ncbi:MAG: hypothetical protein V3S08_07285 [Phycisphaerales bacterium]
MNWINGILTAISNILLAPVKTWPPAVVLIVLSVIAGVLVTIVFRYSSDQKGLKRVANLTKAQLMCLRIFKEDLGVALRCQGDILKSIGRRLWLSLPPMLVLMIPFTLVLTQLSIRYERRPIRTGESVVLAVQLTPESWPNDSDNLFLQVPSGVVVETPALRDEAAHTVYWRLGLREPADGPLTIKAGYHSIEKSFIGTDDTDRLCNVSPRRPGTGFLDRLIYPAEPGFGGDSPVQSVDLRYPARSTPIFGIDMPWWGTFFIVSMLAAICVRPFLKVQF